MNLLTLLVILIAIGVAMYLIPMDGRIKQIIYVVVAIVVVLLLLQLLLPGFSSIRIGR